MSDNSANVLDELFGEAPAEPTPIVEGDANAPAESAEIASETSEDAGNAAVPYLNLKGTFASLEAASEAFPGQDLVSMAMFANKVTVRNVMAGQGEEGYVSQGAVYQAAKAKTAEHALPVVLVDGSALIPLTDGMTAWDAKPVRGEGSGGSATSGVLDDDTLAERTFKAIDTLAKDKRRAATLAEKIKKGEALVAKRTAQAKARFGEDAWEAKVDAAGERLEASKAISDNDADQTSTDSDNATS